jgi:hypothetical protein
MKLREVQQLRSSYASLMGQARRLEKLAPDPHGEGGMHHPQNPQQTAQRLRDLAHTRKANARSIVDGIKEDCRPNPTYLEACEART